MHRSRLRTGLLVFQGALSVVLLVGAGLFVRILHNVQSMRLGYDADRVLVADLHMRGMKLDSAQAVALAEAVARGSDDHPRRRSPHRSGSRCPSGCTWNTSLYVAGIDSVERLGEFDLNAVTPDYFATMGTRILRGRGITDADVAGRAEGDRRERGDGEDALAGEGCDRPVHQGGCGHRAVQLRRRHRGEHQDAQPRG